MIKYKLKDFAKWAKKQKIGDWVLVKAVEEMNSGLLGDRLGSYVFKKRIGVGGKGKRAGARTIICFKREKVAIFMYGYSKNEQTDITPNELEMLREFSKGLIELSEDELANNVAAGKLVKVEEVN